MGRTPRELADLGVELLGSIESAVDAKDDGPGGQLVQRSAARDVFHVQDDDVGIETFLEKLGGLDRVGHGGDVVTRLVQLAVQISPEVVLRFDQ